MANLLLVLAALLSITNGSKLRRRSITTEQFLLASDAAKPVDLTISTRDAGGRNQTAPYLYGIMFEDISHSGDGGIYGELLTNRAFHGSAVKDGMKLPIKPDLTGWTAVGGCQIALDTKNNPLSKALPNVVKVTVPANARGECGIANTGWWGLDVRPQTYKASFHVKAARPGAKASFRVGLKSALSGEFAATKIEHRTLSGDYVEINAEIKNTQTAPNTNNVFTLTVDGSEAAGQTFYFGLVSLFGETFKGRKNGLRKDLGEAFNDLKPKFLRFPGGNNLEGISQDTRWKWFETVGPLKDRPGRPGNWGYYNTDGLGLLEYLEWCEDMNMEPVLAVYAGYALGGVRDATRQQMPGVLQEALDMLEYCMGSTSTRYGALRAKHGHPKPVQVKFVEIGNEDWFSKTYDYRWPFMYSGLKKHYPNITYISTVHDESGNHLQLPPGTMWDTHHYEEPKFFLKNFNFYDHWQEREKLPGVGVLLGEYSVFQEDTTGGGGIDWSRSKPIHVRYPRLLSALAEGVYALGGERNPGTVWMSSYAPSLMRRESSNWTPNMIYFTTDQTQTVRSPSYWQQWMFARYRGTHTLPVAARGAFNPLFWAASIEEGNKDVYLKVINTGAETVPLKVNLDPQYSRVRATILTSNDVNDANDFNTTNRVRPRTIDEQVRVDKGKMQWDVPRWSITILHYSRA